MYTQNKEDRKKVEKALDLSGFPTGKNDSIPLQKFEFEDFFNFYKYLTQRTDADTIFKEIINANNHSSSKKKLMSVPQLVEFLNQTKLKEIFD